MEKDLFEMLTKVQRPEIPECSHENVIFVDDLSQTIGNKSLTELKVFFQILYEITVRYIKINILANNCSKTEVLSVP